MPELCRFMGIIIRMYRREHPPPHFHAIYAEHEATYTFDGELLEGELPRKQDRLVRAWAGIHEEDLERCWEQATSDGDLGTIEPLP